jgi:hypothetical protein
MVLTPFIFRMKAQRDTGGAHILRLGAGHEKIFHPGVRDLPAESGLTDTLAPLHKSGKRSHTM